MASTQHSPVVATLGIDTEDSSTVSTAHPSQSEVDTIVGLAYDELQSNDATMYVLRLTASSISNDDDRAKAEFSANDLGTLLEKLSDILDTGYTPYASNRTETLNSIVINLHRVPQTE